MAAAPTPGTVPGMSTGDRSRVVGPRRDAIAYHEAGHAVVGHAQGLRFSRIYIGDAGGRVVFDHQWSEDTVLGDAELLDRYALMLLAATSAEFRHTGTVVGASGDIVALTWLLRRARERGAVPRSDRWRRADAEAVRHWPAITAVADELAYRSTPVADPATLLAQHPDLGAPVGEVTGARAQQLFERRQGQPDRASEATVEAALIRPPVGVLGNALRPARGDCGATGEASPTSAALVGPRASMRHGRPDLRGGRSRQA
jgi:hypothetical protein